MGLRGRGSAEERRPRGGERQPRAGAHSAVLSACSNALSPKEPSSRAVTLPSLPTTKSHGSDGSPNCLQRLAEALVRIVVRVDLLMDEVDLVAVLRLELQRDVDHRAADARLAQLRRGEEQRDRLLADDVGEGLLVHVARRPPRVDRLDVAAGRGDRVRLRLAAPGRPTAGIVSSPGAIIWICPGAATGLPSTSVTAMTRVRPGLAGQLDVRGVDGGERVGLRRGLLGAVRRVRDQHVGGRRERALGAATSATSRSRAPSCRRRSPRCRRSRRRRSGCPRPRGRRSRPCPSPARRRSRPPAPAASCPRSRGSRTPCGSWAARTCSCRPLGTWATGSSWVPPPAVVVAAAAGEDQGEGAGGRGEQAEHGGHPRRGPSRPAACRPARSARARPRRPRT